MVVNSEPVSAPAVKARSRATTALWWLLMVEVGLLLTLLPTFAALLILDPAATNPALFALLAIPVGPALQAGIFALRRGKPGTNERPWNRFWEGWRLGW